MEQLQQQMSDIQTGNKGITANAEQNMDKS